MFLLDGDADLYSDVKADALALTAGGKSLVDDTGAIGEPAAFTDAELEALMAAVNLTELPSKGDVPD